MTTAKSDTRTAPKVAPRVETARTDVSAPLVGTVSAGAAAPVVTASVPVTETLKDGTLFRKHRSWKPEEKQYLIAEIVGEDRQKATPATLWKADNTLLGCIVMVPALTPDHGIPALIEQAVAEMEKALRRHLETSRHDAKEFREALQNKYPYLSVKKTTTRETLIAAAKGAFGDGWIKPALGGKYEMNAWTAAEALNIAGAYAHADLVGQWWLEGALQDIERAKTDPGVKEWRERFEFVEIVGSEYARLLKDPETQWTDAAAVAHLAEHMGLSEEDTAKYLQAWDILRTAAYTGLLEESDESSTTEGSAAE